MSPMAAMMPSVCRTVRLALTRPDSRSSWCQICFGLDIVILLVVIWEINITHKMLITLVIRDKMPQHSPPFLRGGAVPGGHVPKAGEDRIEALPALLYPLDGIELLTCVWRVPGGWVIPAMTHQRPYHADVPS